MQRTIMLLCFILLSFVSKSQVGNILQPLFKGDNLPDIILGFDSNSGKTILTKDLKGKLIIFDFWNIWCSSCIAAFPKMESLQNQFKEKLQIILVTKNTLKQGEDLLKKRNKPIPNLAMIYEDSVLHKLFPHKAEPYHAWVLPNGQVGYMTEGYNATAKNISDVLMGIPMSFSYRREISDLDISKSLLDERDRLKEYVSAYSILMKGLYTISNDNRINVQKDETNGKIIKIQMNNSVILRLFSFAYNKELYGFESHLSNLFNNRILLLDSVARELEFPSDNALLDKWHENNLYSYEIFLPAEKEYDIYKYMQQDLNRYFNVEAKIEKKLVKVLAITKISPHNLTVNPKKGSSIEYRNDTLIINNTTIQRSLYPSLVKANYYLSLPVVDETNYFSPIDLNLFGSLNDLKSIKEQLRKHGLDLVEKESFIDMLVIKSKN